MTAMATAMTTTVASASRACSLGESSMATLKSTMILKCNVATGGAQIAFTTSFDEANVVEMKSKQTTDDCDCASNA